MIKGIAFRNIRATTFHHYDQLNFMMEVVGCERVGDRGAGCDDRTVRLHEKDRWIGFWIATHFSHVICIVLANAKDAVNPDVMIRCAGCQCRGIGRANDQCGHGLGPLRLIRPDHETRGATRLQAGTCQFGTITGQSHEVGVMPTAA